MIRIWINGQQQDGIDEGWIARTIQGFRREGQRVCVRVSVKTEDIDVTVTAGQCPSAPGGVRVPSGRESAVLAHWANCRLGSDPDFPSGQLIGRLKRLERML